MKLEELHFKNYRLFKQLDIIGLKRINLIAGKNNTGKTALLEGIRILVSRADSIVINHILQKRGEFTRSWASSYKAIFHNDGNPNKSIYGDFTLKLNELEIQLVQSRKTSKYENFQVSIEGEVSHQLDSNASAESPPNEDVVYIPYQYQLSEIKQLWDNISLTHKEEDVIKVVKETVLPSLKRIGFSNDRFMVLLDSNPEPVPIASLGDGVQRVLGLALALANAQNKILLIDEFESGLHHSVQERLWHLVFKYATQWDIQTFITTHSEDTLRNFYYVGLEEKYKKTANFIRLQYSRQDILETISYDMDRLEKALELELEIR